MRKTLPFAFKSYTSVLLIFLLFAVSLIIIKPAGALDYTLLTVITCAVLTLAVFMIIRKTRTNINKLRTFTNSIEQNETPNTTAISDLPNDELGDLAKRLSRIYKRLQDTSEEQNRLKRELTQNIAHELKTPIASIQGYLETIINNPGIDKNTKNQFIERCYAQSERLTSLLNDISTLSRLDDAPNVIEYEDIQIYDMVCDIQKETALQLRQKGMLFHNLVSVSTVVKGNRSQLYSVFRNLTDNAIAYAGDNTIIKLSAYDDKYYWHFTFSDNGIGIAPEHINRIFERFYRIDDGRTRKLGGTGLGLAIVKNIILQHGGSIFAYNNDDKGVRFDFSLRK